jgi:hypothetical protein
VEAVKGLLEEPEDGGFVVGKTRAALAGRERR